MSDFWIKIVVLRGRIYVNSDYNFTIKISVEDSDMHATYTAEIIY